jgi:5-methylcytosine-specific restriction endonuclease McrA
MGLKVNNRIKMIDIGTTFGNITITGLPERFSTGKTVRMMFPCECKCGRKTKITGTELRKGKRTRCTYCAYRERPQSELRLTNLERMYNLSIVGRCKKTKINNYLSIEDYSKIIKQDCYYCGEPPNKIHHLSKNRVALREDFYANGVDRLDSTKDYVIENCVACCKQCNIMKMDYTIKEFFTKIKTIYKKWQQDVIIKEN